MFARLSRRLRGLPPAGRLWEGPVVYCSDRNLVSFEGYYAAPDGRLDVKAPLRRVDVRPDPDLDPIATYYTV